jgi:hypothetical protein
LANDRVGRPISEAMMQAAISFELFCIDVLSQEGGTLKHDPILAVSGKENRIFWL